MAEQTHLATVRLSPTQVQFLNRQIASMARLNMPIAKGLRILARDVQEANFKALIEALQQDLDEGVSLKDALAKYPATFSRLHLEIIKAGETTGNLAVILEELNAHTASMQRIRGRILEAIAYPAVISSIIFCFVIFFLYFVAPSFEAMLSQRMQVTLSTGGVELDPGAPPAPSPADDVPPLTRAFFGLSHLVQNEVVLFLLILGGVGVAGVMIRRVSRMGEEYDEFLFRLPVFGELFKGAALMKVTRTMRDLLSNGVSMVETLRLTSSTVGKNQIEHKLNELRLAVEDGGSFSRNLSGGGVFPDTMVWKLQMAEEKGIIEQALGELANEFEADVDQRTTVITKMLTPLLLVAMGGVVFLMFLACFEPLTRSAAGG
jgi:type II secretory pathway component PulF